MDTSTPRNDLVTPQPHSPEETAHARLHDLSSHMTEPRVCALAVLIQDVDTLSHQAVCGVPPDGPGIDCVTVYRILDWLAVGGIVHKTAGAGRVFRFSLTEHDTTREVAHRSHSYSHCTQCERDFCLEDAEPPAMLIAALPVGLAADHAELAIKGTCAGYAPLTSHHETGNTPCPKRPPLSF